MPVAQEYGGMGLGITEVIAVMEGLGYGSADQGLLFSLNAHMWTSTMPISLYGTPEQKQ
jgi:alkylation response protein AidB-like acyl-CoA dehydrogenase